MASSLSQHDFKELLSLTPTKDLAKGHILLIDKPLAWTSFNVVGKVRYLLRHQLGYQKIKVGHAGTLDPLATGLMVLCIGKATKLAAELTGHDKRYIATFTLGARTVSHDLETPVEKGGSFEAITQTTLEQVMHSMEGKQMQVPPLFSAKWVDGRRAYSLARSGEQSTLPPVPVVIRSFQLIRYNATQGIAEADILCSKGTYIRAIARDLGESLGCGAYLSGLRRTHSGQFSVDNAVSIGDFEEWVAVQSKLRGQLG